MAEHIFSHQSDEFSPNLVTLLVTTLFTGHITSNTYFCYSIRMFEYFCSSPVREMEWGTLDKTVWFLSVEV